MSKAPYSGRQNHDKGQWWGSSHKTEKVTEVYWKTDDWYNNGWKDVKSPMPDCVERPTHWDATASSDPDPSSSWTFGNPTEAPIPTTRPVSLKPNGSSVHHKEYKKTSRTTSSHSQSRSRPPMHAAAPKGTSRSRSGARDRPGRGHKLPRRTREALRASLDWWQIIQPNPQYSSMPMEEAAFRYIPEDGDPLESHLWKIYCPPPLLGGAGGKYKMPWAKPSMTQRCSFQGYDRDCRKGVLCWRYHSRKYAATPFTENDDGDYVPGDYRAREGTNLQEEQMFDNEILDHSTFWSLGWRIDLGVPDGIAPRFYDMTCQEILPMPNDPNFGWYWRYDPRTMVPVLQADGSTIYAAECRAPLPTVRGRAYPQVVGDDDLAPPQEYFPAYPPEMYRDGNRPAPTENPWACHNCLEEVLTPTEVPVESSTAPRVPSTPVAAPTVGHYSSADESSTEEAYQHASTDLPSPGVLIHESHHSTTDRVVLVDHISKCPHGTTPAAAKFLMTAESHQAMMVNLQSTNDDVARSRSQSRDASRIRPAGQRPMTPNRGRKSQSPAASRPVNPASVAQEAAERLRANASVIVARGGSPARERPRVPMPIPAPTTAHEPLQPLSPPTDASTRLRMPEYHWMASIDAGILQQFASLDTPGQQMIMSLFPFAEHNYGKLDADTLDRLTRNLAIAKEAYACRMAEEAVNVRTVAALREALEAKCLAPTEKPIPNFSLFASKPGKAKAAKAQVQVKQEVKVQEVVSSDEESPGKKPKMTAIRTPPRSSTSSSAAPVPTESHKSTIIPAEDKVSAPPGLSLTIEELPKTAEVAHVPPSIGESTVPRDLETSMPTAEEDAQPLLALPVTNAPIHGTSVAPIDALAHLANGSTFPMELPNDDDVPTTSPTASLSPEVTPFDDSPDQFPEAEQSRPDQSEMSGPPPISTNSPTAEEGQNITPHANGPDAASSSTSSSESTSSSDSTESTSVSGVPTRVPSPGSNGPSVDSRWTDGTGPFAPRSLNDASSAAAGGILTEDSMSSPAARNAILVTEFDLENGFDSRLLESTVVGALTYVNQAQTVEIASTLPIPPIPSLPRSPPVDEVDSDWGVSDKAEKEAEAAYAAERKKQE